MAENNKDIRLSVRVPQPLKDKVEVEAKKLGLSQSEFVRYVMITYFSDKEKE